MINFRAIVGVALVAAVIGTAAPAFAQNLMDPIYTPNPLGRNAETGTTDFLYYGRRRFNNGGYANLAIKHLSALHQAVKACNRTEYDQQHSNLLALRERARAQARRLRARVSEYRAEHREVIDRMSRLSIREELSLRAIGPRPTVDEYRFLVLNQATYDEYRKREGEVEKVEEDVRAFTALLEVLEPFICKPPETSLRMPATPGAPGSDARVGYMPFDRCGIVRVPSGSATAQFGFQFNAGLSGGVINAPVTSYLGFNNGERGVGVSSSAPRSTGTEFSAALGICGFPGLLGGGGSLDFGFSSGQYTSSSSSTQLDPSGRRLLILGTGIDPFGPGLNIGPGAGTFNVVNDPTYARSITTNQFHLQYNMPFPRIGNDLLEVTGFVRFEYQHMRISESMSGFLPNLPLDFRNATERTSQTFTPGVGLRVGVPIVSNTFAVTPFLEGWIGPVIGSVQGTDRLQFGGLVSADQSVSLSGNHTGLAGSIAGGFNAAFGNNVELGAVVRHTTSDSFPIVFRSGEPGETSRTDWRASTKTSFTGSLKFKFGVPPAAPPVDNQLGAPIKRSPPAVRRANVQDNGGGLKKGGSSRPKKGGPGEKEGGAQKGNGGQQSAFAGSKVGAEGLGPNSVQIVYTAPCTVGCRDIRLIQVLHVLDPRGNKSYPPQAGLKPSPDTLPEPRDAFGAHVVDKRKIDNGLIAQEPFNSPYYLGTSPADEKLRGQPAGAPAILKDAPTAILDGYTGVFEVCAFCHAGQDRGQFLGCITWRMVGENAPTIGDPTPAPSADFMRAVNQWNENHDFKMPEVRSGLR